MRRIFLLVILLMLWVPHVQAQDKVSVVILYSHSDELSYISEILDPNSVTYTGMLLDEDLNLNLDNYDAMILASSFEISLTLSTQKSMNDFLKRSGTRSVIITPYLEDFDDIMENSLGIVGKEELHRDSNITSWQVNLKKNMTSYQVGEKFNYIGPLGEYIYSNVEVLAEVVASNNTEFGDLTYPIPILINSSSVNALVSSASLMVNASEPIEGLKLDAFPFPDFLQQILSPILNDQVGKASINQTATSITGSNTNTDTGNNNLQLPQANYVYPLGAILLALIALLFRRILELIRWLSEKFMFFGVGILGAYFNIQDRNLNQGDVLLNKYRAQILDVLDLLGSNGAYLRELKSITNLGSGSLLWHLQTLEDFGMIYKFSVKRYTVFVAFEYAEDFNHEQKRLELELQSRHSRTLLAILVTYRSDDIISIDELIEDVDISRKTAQRFIKKLEKEELIQREPSGFSMINRKMLVLMEENLRNREDIMQGKIVLE